MRRRPARCSLLVALISLVFTLAAPAAARAASYSVSQVDITAEVRPDGLLDVTERRSFNFDDDVNGVYWEIPLSQNLQGKSSAPQVREVAEESGGSQASLEQAGSASNGDAGVYTVEQDGSSVRLKVFSPHASGDTATFAVSYTLTGAVMAWPDTAELYWKYVGDGWDADSDDVSLKVTFAGAAASGVAATAGDDAANLRAWGHGPLDGDVQVSTAGPSVSYTVPSVHAGEFAEARIAFPTAWVPGLAAGAPSSESVDANGDRLPKILEEERGWAEKANEQRAQARLVLMVFAVLGALLSIGFFIVVVALKIKAGPKPKSSFQETYFRDVPSSDHPAVIARFMNKTSYDNRALVSTLMKLTNEKVVEVSKTTRSERGLLGRERAEEDYLLTVPAGAMDRLTDPIDRSAVRIYLGTDSGQVAFGDIKGAVERDADAYSERWADFRSEVHARLEERHLVGSTGFAAGVAGTLVGASGIALAIVFGVLSGWWPIAVVGGPLAVAGIILSWTFKRLTPEGAELRARCEALKRWLEDFTRLGEAVPGDVVLWNKLLVMAVALGVSDKVLADLAAATPQSFDDDYSDGYYPAWWWCTGHGGMGSPVSSFNEASGLALSEIASSPDSSGDGFGGGFSGGGGGGTGGGGGGTF